MKILQIHDYPPFEGGGIEINVSRVSRELVKAGHEVVIATSRFKSETYGGKMEENFGGVKAILLEDLNKLEEYLNWADVVHVHFTFSCRPASMLALERCVETEKKCIFSVHTNYAHIPFSSLATMSKLEKDEKLKKLSRFLSADVVTIVAPSESTKESLKRLGVNKEVEVINNGLESGLRGTSCFKKIDKVDVTYVGELSILKGTNYLIDAIREVRKTVPGVKLRLVGGGSDAGHIRTMVEFFGLEKNVQLVGYVKNEEVINYLKKTKIVVHPSLTETWCLAVAEALECGVPVISTAVEGLVDLTKNGRFAQLVEPANVSMLASAISRAIQTKEGYRLLKNKAKLGQCYVRKYYTLVNQMSKTINIYNQI